MKALTFLFRLLLYVAGGLLAAIFAFWIYVIIPRSLGEVEVHRVSLVTGSVIDRVENDHPYQFHPQKLLRIEISSERDLSTRARAVGGTPDLYTYSNCCPLKNSITINSSTLGPFPDDMPVFLPFRLVPLPTGFEAKFEGDGYRHAVRKADQRYHYTIYVDADNLGDVSRDLRLRIVGVSMFSPHAESDTLTIPSLEVRHALQRGVSL